MFPIFLSSLSCKHRPLVKRFCPEGFNDTEKILLTLRARLFVSQNNAFTVFLILLFRDRHFALETAFTFYSELSGVTRQNLQDLFAISEI